MDYTTAAGYLSTAFDKPIEEMENYFASVNTILAGTGETFTVIGYASSKHPIRGIKDEDSKDDKRKKSTKVVKFASDDFDAEDYMMLSEACVIFLRERGTKKLKARKFGSAPVIKKIVEEVATEAPKTIDEESVTDTDICEHCGSIMEFGECFNMDCDTNQQEEEK